MAEEFPTYEAAIDFCEAVEEDDSVRILVDPATPMRGTDSHDGVVSDIKEENGVTRIRVNARKWYASDFPDSYESKHMAYRFSIPSDERATSSPIRVYANDLEQLTTNWEEVGYLVGAGILRMFESD